MQKRRLISFEVLYLLLLTLNSTFWCIFFQLASPQSFLTLQQAAGSHTGQSQMITLPITNAAGQQQLLTIPVTLAQGQGGVQFLIPTSGGLFAANISSLTPVSPQVGHHRHITTEISLRRSLQVEEPSSKCQSSENCND